ncbi:MAG: cation:proton antiporter [Puniceicoccales bacterium]|nr:cation:proton antiporter [Puniceicoccales bacterium]
MAAVHIIHDLSLLLLMASIAALAARALHIPTLLAYILAGVLLGLPSNDHNLIHDEAVIEQLSELGVLFLMFYMGLEFEIRKLRQLFAPSMLALLFQTFFMLFLGRTLAPILGWGGLNGLFLGGLLAISSTMITLPILDAGGMQRKGFAKYCIGILIFEDILAILLLVILSGIAITGHFAWDAMGRVIFFVGAFVVSVFLLGRLAATPLIRALQKFHSDELLTVVTVGILFGIGLLAEISSFSLALGAFLAGSVFSGTALAEPMEGRMQPIRTLFSAIFFLSVGLMVDLPTLWVHKTAILLLTIAVFSLKIISCFIGLFLSGQDAAGSFCASLCKAQIGEFSFVIAALGSGLGVTDGGLLNIAVGASMGTIICTALIGPHGEKICKKLARWMPKSLQKLGHLYQSALAIIRGRLSKNTLVQLAAKPLVYIVMDTFLFLAILVAASIATRFAAPLLPGWVSAVDAGIWGIAAVVSLPCALQIVRQTRVLLFILLSNALPQVQSGSRASFLVPRLGGIFQSAILLLVVLFFSGTFLLVAAPSLPSGVPLYAFVLILAVAGLLLRSQVLKLNAKIGEYFIETFDRDVQSQLAQQRKAMLQKIQNLAPLGLDLASVRIGEGRSGCCIQGLALAKNFGVNAVALRCGHYLSYAPRPDLPLLAGHELLLLGTRENLERAQEFLSTAESSAPADGEDFEIAQIGVEPLHALVGKSLMESNLRRHYGVSVVEIRRAAGPISLPSAAEILQANDILVVVGEGGAIRRLRDGWERVGSAA